MDQSAIFLTDIYLKGHLSLCQLKSAKIPHLTIPDLKKSPLLPGIVKATPLVLNASVVLKGKNLVQLVRGF